MLWSIATTDSKRIIKATLAAFLRSIDLNE